MTPRTRSTVYGFPPPTKYARRNLLSCGKAVLEVSSTYLTADNDMLGSGSDNGNPAQIVLETNSPIRTMITPPSSICAF